MPVIKSAKKKLRQDKKRQERNKGIKNLLKALLKAYHAKPSEELMKKIFSTTDKAAKNHLIHKNKAARVKSSLAKIISGEKKITPVAKKPKKVVKKKVSPKKK